jgi:succinate dehydrogenase/fumarate reductase flavoprotein subunit
MKIDVTPTLKRVDVAVLGSGGAGLLAALEAARQGKQVVVLSKGQIGRSGATATITGDVSVDGTAQKRLGMRGDLRDDAEAFFEDTMKGGAYLNDPVLAQAMVEEVGEEMAKLVNAGLKIVGLGHAPGHRSPRGVLVSGMQMLQILSRQAAAEGVLFRDEFYATDVLVDDGRCVGVAGVDLRTGEINGVLASSVVIATGGGAMVYPVRTAPSELVGDGYRMALDAGADLVDMEMVQFLPCCLVDPPIWRGIQFPWILGPQSGTRAWLLNRYGERFMARYDPERMEMSTRDKLSIACVREVLEGRGGPSGGVFMSWAHLPKDILEFLPQWYGKPLLHSGWRWEGFDFAPLVERIQNGHAVEVGPAAHFHMGGIRVDVDGATSVPGLFACGEVTGGVHGANRLSGNACTQFLVQGSRTGRAAAGAASHGHASLSPRTWHRAMDRIGKPLKCTPELRPHEVMEHLQETCRRNLNVVRDGDGLEQALADVHRIRQQELPRTGAGPAAGSSYNRAWIDALQVESAARTVEAIALSASRRKDSRGAHFRSDHPHAQREFDVNHWLRLQGETLECGSVPIDDERFQGASP